LRRCSALRSAHRDNEMNDERHKKDVLTSAVLQKALLNMPLGVILECEATRST
jgi:hypothetical protein